jgi:hypothetical protein
MEECPIFNEISGLEILFPALRTKLNLANLHLFLSWSGVRLSPLVYASHYLVYWTSFR